MLDFTLLDRLGSDNVRRITLRYPGSGLEENAYLGKKSVSDGQDKMDENHNGMDPSR